MRRSGGPVGFWNIHKNLERKPVDFLKDRCFISLAGPCVLSVRKYKSRPGLGAVSRYCSGSAIRNFTCIAKVLCTFYLV